MNMPTNYNKSESTEPSYRFYKPPHLRDTKRQLNKNTSKNANNNYSKVNNYDETSLGIEEPFSRLSIPPRRKIYDFNISKYFDCKFKGTHYEYKKKLEESTTLYIGNLHYASTESDIRELFSKAGNIKTVIMGIDKKTNGPGGFCFIEYETRTEAEKCVSMKGISLDDNTLCIDWDAGYTEGRQYTRRRNQRSRIIYSTNQKVNNSRNSRVKYEEDYRLQEGP